MAPRAVGMARKPAAEETLPAVEPDGGADDATPEPVALALAPLIAPYKKRGRIKLRIERLPRRARLSQGQNNGDGSWSLMLDELEDLQYLPPEGSTDVPVLSIRILRVEAGDATTLAVLDYALPVTSRAKPAGTSDLSAGPARKSSDDAEFRRLRNELAKAQAGLALREAELAEAREEAEQAKAGAPQQGVEKELASARESWEVELQARLAALTNDRANDLQRKHESWRHETEAALAQAEKQWKAAEAERLAAAEARWKEDASRSLTLSRVEADALRGDNAELGRLRERVESLLASLSRSESEVAKAQADAAAADERARKNSAQSRAEVDALRSDNAELGQLRERVGALQASLSKSESAVAKARADATAADERARKTSVQSRAEVDALRSDNAELGRLREKIEALQSSLSKSESEVAKARADAAAAEERARKSVAQSRAEAESLRAETVDLGRLREKVQTLQSSLDKRESDFTKLCTELTESEERARRDIERARADTDALRGNDAELERLRDRVSRLQTSLTARDEELVQARADVVEAENRGHKDVETALARAEKTWKADEEARLQAAEARWNDQASRAQAETKGHVKDRDEELRRLRNELERTQKTVAEREASEKAARGDVDDARREARHALEEVLSRAESEKSAIEARWQEQFAQAVGAVTAQLGRSEKALADARTEIDSLRGGDSEIDRLRREQAELKGSLAERDNDLQRARSAIEDTRSAGKREMDEALARAESLWQSGEAARLVAAERRWKEQSKDAMEQASAHAQRAETAQSKLHAQDEALKARTLDYQRSRDECAALRDALAQKENELAQARWTLIQTRERKAAAEQPPPPPSGRSEEIWSAETLGKLNRPIGVPRDRLFDPHNTLGEPEPEIEEAPRRNMGRDLIVVAILAVVVVVGGLRFAPDSWWATIMPASNQSQSQSSKSQAAPAVQPAATPSLPQAMIVRSANLRSGPSKTADAVTTLAKGAKVSVVDHKGNWVQIRTDALDAKHKGFEGWVFNTYLSETTLPKDHPATKSP